jgi:hypothetical protein
MIQGFIHGISSLIGKVKNIISHMAHTIIDGLHHALEIRSPSRVMMKIGGYVGDGFAIGIQQSVGRIQHQAQYMARAAITAMSENSYRRNGGYDYFNPSQRQETGKIEYIFNFNQPIYTRNEMDIQKLADIVTPD